MDTHELDLFMGNGAILSVDPARNPQYQVIDSLGIFPVDTDVATAWLKDHDTKVVATAGTYQEVVLAEYADLFHLLKRVSDRLQN